MKPVQVGETVNIDQNYIPATKIHVDNAPGYDEDDGKKIWKPLHFEVLFNDGKLWVIDQGLSATDVSMWISVIEYPKWSVTETYEYPGSVQYLSSWEKFLELYLEKRNMAWTGI